VVDARRAEHFLDGLWLDSADLHSCPMGRGKRIAARARIAGIISRSFRIFFLTLTLRYPRQSEELRKLARSQSERKLWPIQSNRSQQCRR
jgi:hypothetical protein